MTARRESCDDRAERQRRERWLVLGKWLRGLAVVTMRITTRTASPVRERARLIIRQRSLSGR